MADIYDWSAAGYREGANLPDGSAITPDATCVLTPNELRASPYRVVANDGLDDTDGIQAAIDFIKQTCSDASDAAHQTSYSRLAEISFPAGTLNVHTQLSVDADYVVLHGAGADPATGTHFVFKPDAATRYDALTSKGGDQWDQSKTRAEDASGATLADGSGGWLWPGRGLFHVQSRQVASKYLTNGEYAAAVKNKDIFEGTVNDHWTTGLTLRNGLDADGTEMHGYAARAGQTVVALACSTKAGPDDEPGDIPNTCTKKPASPDRIAGITVGGYINIMAANTVNFYKSMGVDLEAAKSEDYLQNLQMRQQIFQVKAVDITKRTVTLDKPLEFDVPVDALGDGSDPTLSAAYDLDTESKASPLVDPVLGVGIEDLSLTQDETGINNPTDTTKALTSADAVHNYGNLDPAGAMHGIVLKWVVNSFVRNVRTDMTGSHPIVTEQAKNLTITNNQLNGAWNKGKGGNGYFRGARVWDSIYAGNVTRNLRHFTFQWSASGNVAIGNSFDSDLNLHGGYERNNLFELNSVAVPFEHRSSNCTAHCGGEGGATQGDDSNWFPIWWAAGNKAVKWSGASGPNNVFHNNAMSKQLGDKEQAYTAYYPNRATIYQFGTTTGRDYKLLEAATSGVYAPISDWAGQEQGDYSGGHGVESEKTDSAPSIFLKTVPVPDGQPMTAPISSMFGTQVSAGYSDDPVNVATGNYTEKDALLGFEPEWTPSLSLTYNSRDVSSTGFGPGWSSLTAEKIVRDTDGVAHVTLPDGRVLDFKPSDTAYLSPPGFDGALVRAAADTWTLSDPMGDVDHFDAAGLVSQFEGSSGKVINVVRDSASRVVQIASPTGYQLTLSYNDDGTVSTVTGGDGRVVKLSYDGGRLSAIDPPGTGSKAFAYDSADNLATVKDADGKTIVTNTYDSERRVVQQERPGSPTEVFRYNDAAGTTELLDLEGNVLATYAHDEAGRLTYVGTYDGSTSTRSYDDAGRPIRLVDPNGSVQSTTYTSTGLLASQTSAGGATSTYAYDSSGRMTKATDPEGAVTSYEYTGNGPTPTTVTLPGGGTQTVALTGDKVTASTDPDGHTTRLGYDAKGNVTSIKAPGGGTTEVTYDAVGRLISETSPSGQTTSTTYDSAGRTTKVSTPQGVLSQTTYTPAGRVATSTDANGGTTSYTYDSAGRVATRTSPTHAVTTYSYNAQGDLAKAVDGAGVVTTMVHDELGRLSSSTTAGKVISYSYDAAGNQTSSSGSDDASVKVLDAEGQVLQETTADGGVTTHTYDANGNEIATTGPDGASGTSTLDADGNMTKDVDPLGRVTKRTYTPGGLLASVTDPLSHTTKYGYDSDGNLTSVTSPSDHAWKYQYDDSGNQTSVTSPTGLVTSNTYDIDGNLTRTTDAADRTLVRTYTLAGNPATSTASGQGTRKFTYDTSGRMISSTDALGGVTTFVYDATGNLTSRTDPRGGKTTFTYARGDQLLTQTDPLGRTTTRTWDDAGHVQKLTLPDGSATGWDYDAMGRTTARHDPDGVTVEWTYDLAGRVTSMTDTQGKTTYFYDVAGQLSRVTGPDSKSFAYAYNDAGQLSTITYPDGVKVTYTYDLDGHLTSMHDGDGHAVTYTLDADGRVTASTSTQGAVRTFSYLDGQLSKYTEQLTSTGDTATTTMTHDASGRISATKTGNATTKYLYDKAGQLTSITPPIGPETTYTYDAAGNRASASTGTQNDEYTYDDANELTAITRDNTPYSSLTYDPVGRLTKQTSTDGQSLTLTYDSDGRPTTIDNLTARGRQSATLAYDGAANLHSITTSVTRTGATAPVTATTDLRWTGGGGTAQVATLATTLGSTTRTTDAIYGLGREWAVTSTGTGTSKVSDLSRDALGSMLPTTETAQLGAAASYDAWGQGQEITDLPDVPVGFGYRGELTVADILMLRERAYTASTGRFTSTDPEDPVPGDPASATPYPYAANDPLDLVDPTGRRPVSQETFALASSASAGHCPPVTNDLDRHPKCFQNVIFQTRGFLCHDSLLTGFPCYGSGGKFKPEYTAQAHAIRKLGKNRRTRFYDISWIKKSVDWEVGVTGTSRGRRADIVANEYLVWEVKNRDWTTEDTSDYLQEYVNIARNKGVALNRGTELIGWAVKYHEKPDALEWFTGHRGDRWYAWSDLPGIVWFRKDDDGKRRPIPARVKNNAADGDHAAFLNYVPVPLPVPVPVPVPV